MKFTIWSWKLLIGFFSSIRKDICWCWFYSSPFNLWAMWTHTTDSYEIWVNTSCSKDWRFVKTFDLLYHNGIFQDVLFFVPPGDNMLTVYFMLLLQDFTTLYLMLTTIKIEPKHKVLNQMDLILMELIVLELIMLSIGRKKSFSCSVKFIFSFSHNLLSY